MTQADSVHSTPRRTAFKINAKSSEVSTDPIFDLIETHRSACTAHLDALKVQNRIEELRGASAGSWIREKPCHDENDAFEALVGAAVTTVRALLAKLVQARRQQADD
jgi:hypothetical protein